MNTENNLTESSKFQNVRNDTQQINNDKKIKISNNKLIESENIQSKKTTFDFNSNNSTNINYSNINNIYNNLQKNQAINNNNNCNNTKVFQYDNHNFTNPMKTKVINDLDNYYSEIKPDPLEKVLQNLSCQKNVKV